MLYLVSSPIGNLEDITLRALNTLFSVEEILCEDTRKTLNLLNYYKKPGQRLPKLFSFYEENEEKRIPEVISKLQEGKEIALVTNAGTPAISDPGFKLVRECWRRGIRVVPIPGPSSPIAALACCGLPTDKFLFLGFVPNKSGQRIKLFEKVRQSTDILPSTVIFFESPYRIAQSLLDLQKIFGDIEIIIARELTKIHEEIRKERISNLVEKFSRKPPKGELTVLFNLASEPKGVTAANL
ncbi:MAG: 16S rRNA (cytidine(1402)-2'-O)-methyltransferase [Microgenomates group bacterium]